jgi:hypothetical protein
VNLPFENSHLVPEHDDLDVLVRPGSLVRHNEAANMAQIGEDERESHSR